MSDLRNIQRVEWIGVAVGLVLGTMLHFTYAWFGRLSVVGIFSAVNESVWEHTKLIVTPVLLYAFVEWRVLGHGRRVLVAKALEVLFGVLFIISFFYTYTSALGIEEILLVDILSFYVAVLVGKFLSYRVLRQPQSVSDTRVVAAAVVVLLAIVMQITFTFAAPSIPLFVSK